jgi:hypothetical protein
MRKENATMQTREQYNNSMHSAGRTFTWVKVALMVLVPIVYCLVAGVMPNWAEIAERLPFILTYLVIGLIGAITYAPFLGTGGQYISFLTGNVGNLKLPCALNAQSIAKTTQGSEEQEIVTTIAIAVSAIVTTLIIVIGLIPLAVFQTQIVDMLAPVSPYVIPAIFGGLTITIAAKFYKLAGIPFLICIIICITANLAGMGSTFNQSNMMYIGMIVAGINGVIYYRKQKSQNA